MCLSSFLSFLCFNFLRSFISYFTPPPTLCPPSDLTRINLKSTIEVNYWCQTLNCTETRLRNAVLAVGTLVADVQSYLNR